MRKNIPPLFFLIVQVLGALATPLLCLFAFAEMPHPLTGLYLPPHQLTQKKITELTHYYRQTGMNAVVIHVKDPTGRIFWKSRNPTALEIGAVVMSNGVEKALSRFKAEGIWTIAKVDVFIDHLLSTAKPELGLTDAKGGGLWQDHIGLGWVNPHDRKVWAYITELSLELAHMGFDEIQFDYVRFPSDGNLSAIVYPATLPEMSRVDVIGAFLKWAREHLTTTGVVISVDVFGLVAWKKEDFGVGQQIETIAPFVDVICPMFYPSHFPRGFLGWPNPSDHPFQIMKRSTLAMHSRTGMTPRPWIQGFWYPPAHIVRQIEGLAKAGIQSWMIWNAKADYRATYAALEQLSGTPLTPPDFYPSLYTLASRPPKTITGAFRRVHYTHYQKGYSILSLEQPSPVYKTRYTTPAGIVSTLDEAILDRLLAIHLKNKVHKNESKHTKSIILAEQMCKRLGIPPTRMRPTYILIDWGNTGEITRHRLSPSIPEMGDIYLDRGR